jgi:hypothetical protein
MTPRLVPSGPPGRMVRHRLGSLREPDPGTTQKAATVDAVTPILVVIGEAEVVLCHEHRHQ